jgi:hypothetical protein
MSARAEAAALAAAVAGLALARLLGWQAAAVWFAFLLVLLFPGWALLRVLRLEAALGLAGSATVGTALGLALWVPPLALAFAAHLTLDAVLAGLALETALCVALAVRRPAARIRPALRELVPGALLALAGAYLGWRLSTGVVGDALFHVGRMRKIAASSGLSLSDVSSFAAGPAHAGYAFPLLHGAFAGVARVAAVDESVAFTYLQPLCTLLALLAIFALGRAFTGWRTAGYLAATVALWDLCTLLNGLVMQINQPPPFSFWILTPAALLAFCAVVGVPDLVRRLDGEAVRAAPPGAAAVAALCSVLTISLVHPTYAIPCLVIAAGVALGARAAGVRGLRPAWAGLAGAGLLTIAVYGWIWWVAIRGGVRETVLSHVDEYRLHGTRALFMYPWAPVFGRGYVLAAVLGAPLLVLHRRLLPLAGAFLGLLLLLLTPGVDTFVSGVVGLGQFHRFWQTLPWPYALAAEACLVAGWLARRRPPVWLAAIAAPAALLFWLRGEQTFWRAPTSWAVGAGLALTALALRARRRTGNPFSALVRRSWLPVPLATLLVAALLLGPVWYGFDTVADEAAAGPYRSPFSDLTIRLSPGVVRWFRHHEQPRPVVLGPPDIIFQLVGYADVKAQALPEARTRAEPKAQAAQRRHDEQTFFSPETSAARRLAILRRWRVDLVLLDLRDQPPDVLAQLLADPSFEPLYRDPLDVPAVRGRFVILRAPR